MNILTNHNRVVYKTAVGQRIGASGDPLCDQEAPSASYRPRTEANHKVRRLLIITHTAELGGAEYGLLDIARHYGDRCHVLLFADGPLTQRLRSIGIKYTILRAGCGVSGVRRRGGWLRTLASAPFVMALTIRVARIARHYDVLYPNSQKAAVVSMIMCLLLRRPVVWHMHDILSPEHFGPLQRLLVTRLANLTARRVIVVSEAARKSFVESGGDANRAVVVFDGVDTKLFSAPKPAACTQLRRQLGVENVPLIGLVGRIAPWKGQHVMLAALRDLPGVHLLVVGDALFGEEDFLQQLRELAASYGIADRVHWLGQRDDVPALMRIADIVVHTSTSAEPFGRVIVEAMLAERPVLAADHGAARELLGDDPRALVPPGNAGRLAAAIRTILALPEDKRAAIGSRNRSRAEAIFTLGAMLAGIDQVVALDN